VPIALGISTDGLTLAAAGPESVIRPRYQNWLSVRLWNISDGKEIAQIKLNAGPTLFYKLIFAPDNRSVLVAGDGTVDYVPLVGAKTPRRLQLGGTSITPAADFHPKGKYAAIGGHDGLLRVLDLETVSVARTFHGHASYVDHLSFALDGQRIVSSAGDGLKIWSTATGELLASYLLAEDGEWVLITPEGYFDTSAAQAKMLSVVRGLDIYSIDQVYQSLYRPDLVREKLAGDPQGKVKEAAARLDLGKVIASGSAPSVAIPSPASSTKTDTDEIAVEVAITDHGGGIGRIEWRVNGITLGLEERGLTRVEGDAKAAQI
jgi:WD40 repeat protein